MKRKPSRAAAARGVILGAFASAFLLGPAAHAPAIFAQAARPVSAPDLSLGPGDLRIEQLADGGYHVWIRKKPGISSVLLTESTKDPALKADNYAYRAPELNPVNSGERRMLDGKFLEEKGPYSIIDSTPEPDEAFGSAFHLFIPWVVEWGYPWSRNGKTFISDGTFVNLRAFEKPYADYRGAFADNPYLIRVTQRPLPRPPKVAPPEPVPAPLPKPIPEPVPEPVPVPTPPPPRPVKEDLPPPSPPPPPVEAPKPAPESVPEPAKEPEKKPDLTQYMPETLRAFEAIAAAGKGETRYSEGEGDIVPQLASLLDRAKGKSVDLVVCLDTTDSMKDDIEAVKKAIPEMLKERLAEFSSFRLGFVLYKDYFEDYVVKKFDFTQQFSVFTSGLSAVKVAGGRDIPEAVYEALYTALTEYPWAAEKKMIVLIGDAPPHPIPRGPVDREKVEKEAAARGVELNVIILPH